MLFKSKDKSGSSIDYIIVGLGNPGRQYEGTRHNCGFEAVDRLAEKYNCDMKKIRFKSLTGECRINGAKCLLVKPSTYMNLSGEAVVQAMNFYKAVPSQVIIIFDDISLDVGRMRIRMKGSDGGHNGMKNIIYLTGDDNFPRIKLGVGKKPHPDYDLKDWVLGRFSSNDAKTMSGIYDNAVEAVELMVQDKASDAMQKFN
ncbi:MAG: aminoacyl-tRNA hydrolase [Ruminococcaceae bacterium]|nr:aminoacyl-tRNA hydrolase [Oscillospiraceae bacterium]